MKQFDTLLENILKEYAPVTDTTITAPTKPTTAPTTAPAKPSHPMQPRPGLNPRPKAEDETEETLDEPETTQAPMKVSARGNSDVLKFLQARGYDATN